MRSRATLALPTLLCSPQDSTREIEYSYDDSRRSTTSKCLQLKLGLLKFIEFDKTKANNFVYRVWDFLKTKHYYHPPTHSESCQKCSEDVDENDVLSC